ncbi:putative bifunctional diguanylate cyclase/phosphodiesterase [Pseudomonas sp. NPDC090208]|uniref:putative bifunctional diguanylate cyclase/phosphodiesterase n=1 Tax=Pseudomonas sp. NPDC090208 TaxID=3364478 RepID=UPI00380BE31A
MLDQPIILLVDDQASDLRVLGQALEGLGEIHAATDGQTALELAQHYRPDVILLDVDMPLMDGYSVCEQIKIDPRLAHAVVIFVTSHRQTEHELRALKLGGADFLHKPINLPVARARVEANIKHLRAVQQLAYYDPLTRLPNRMLLLNRVRQALASAQHQASLVGLFSIDLENFKALNDSEGHAVGDALLQETARRLVQCCQSSDTASRAGGQRFMLLILSCNNLAELGHRAQQVLTTLCVPIMVAGTRYDLGACAGIGTFPQDSQDAESLHEHADAALYEARQAGRGQYRFFNAAANDSVRARHQMERDLRAALEAHQLDVFYQAKIDLAAHRVIGVEALVRWPQADGRVVTPDRFIPVAEASGLIVPLGEYVLNSACQAAKHWGEQGYPVSVSVNVSPIQFHDSHFEDAVQHALSSSGIAPGQLELEITEGVLAGEVEETCRTLESLRGRGVRIAVDDFGTGYSSLAYLKRFPLDVLKIDQSFVRQMLLDPKDAAIVETIIQLAHALDLQLVAEGVETPRHANVLYKLGCYVMQGYLYCRPMTCSQMTDYLRCPPAAVAGA